MKPLSLWKHQKVTLDLYRRSNVVYDLSSPGTGKSRVALEAFKERRRSGGGRALIIAPKALLEPAWVEDITKFMPELTYAVAYAKNREAAFNKDVDVYITNTDAARWLAQRKPKFFDSFDTLIVDEISYFKHRDSKRSKALKKISKHFKYRAGLTGTPNSQSVTDFWHQMIILDGGERLGTSFYEFRNVVQIQKPNPKFPQYSIWEDKPGSENAVATILKDISVRHDFDVVMDVPENREYFVYYTPSKKLLGQYEQLKEESILMIEEGVVDAVNAAALRQKLLQTASGCVYGDDGDPVVLDNQRCELIAELIAQRKHSVVFYNWVHQLEQLEKELTKRKIKYAKLTSKTKDHERRRLNQEFQSGEYQALLMHPQTGAHGLTLTKGTAVIWCSPTDRADLLVQGKHRVFRGGQTEKTENIMVCARNTLERGVYKNTDDKRNTMTRFLKILRGEYS